ncbi:PIN domain-containing protein [Agromyces sp. NPDC058484]|uniref:PIN domain-containing protein n=1 Tax=Agromyces sp. NPDC058484 TaxID=3346524 RepID=UPI003656F2EF
MTLIAVDTSVAVPLLVASHPAHAAVTAWARGRTLTLSGHALAETYSVLTRLPGDARVSSPDAVALIDANFNEAAVLDDERFRRIHRELAERGIAGGAVYDGLVGAAAHAHDLPLATRDARARATHEAIGTIVELLT